MTNTLKSVAVATLSTSFSTIYTVPTSTSFTVAVLHLVNTTASSVTVQVCLVPLAGSASQSNALLWDFVIQPNDVIELLRGDIWAAGAFLQTKASAASSVNIKLSGIESV